MPEEAHIRLGHMFSGSMLASQSQAYTLHMPWFHAPMTNRILPMSTDNRRRGAMMPEAAINHCQHAPPCL